MNTYEEMNPQQYFDIVKSRKHRITDADLLQVYDNCLDLLNKYVITGQVKAIKKLLFHLDCIEKERKIIEIGINTFVYRDDIEEYIDNIAKDTVKIIELENYEREIPDSICDLIQQVRPLFDQMYVIFTDYTGSMERQVAKERREKDPILFGTLQNKESKTIIDRFYYIADWEDQYCHLTLDKMVNEMRKEKGTEITRHIKTPGDLKELKNQLENLEQKKDRWVISSHHKPTTIFTKIKSFLSRKS